MNMLRLVRKTNILSCRFLTTTPKVCGRGEDQNTPISGDTTEVSYEEAKPYSSIPSPFSLPLIGNGYLLKMKHSSGVPYGKHPALLHHDLTQKLGPVYKLDLFGFKQLMLSDPKDFEAVFRAEIPNEDFPNAQFPKVPILSQLFV